MNMQSHALPKTFRLLPHLVVFKYSNLVFPIVGAYYILQSFKASLSYNPDPTTLLITILITVFGFVLLLGFCSIFFLSLCNIHMEMTEQGITIYDSGYKVYTPWQNLAALGTKQIDLSSHRGFYLKERAVIGLSIAEGKQHNIAVLVTDIRARLLFFTTPSDFISLSYFVTEESEYDENNEFWSYIRHFAPQVFEPNHWM